MDCLWLDIDGILDVMEDDDNVPDWWESDWTFVESDYGWTSRGK